MTALSSPSQTIHHSGAKPVQARAAGYPSSLAQLGGFLTSGKGLCPHSLFQDGDPIRRSTSCVDIPIAIFLKSISKRRSRMTHKEIPTNSNATITNSKSRNILDVTFREVKQNF